MKQNILALYLIKLSKWFSLVMPIIVLFYEDHGLGLQDVFILKSVYSVAAVTLEIPSGYLADVWGRKKCLILGCILFFGGYLCYSAEAIAGIFGGLLAAYSLRLPFYAQAFVAFIGIPAAFALQEFNTKSKVQNPVSEILRILKYSLVTNRKLCYNIMFSGIIGAATLTMAWFVQPVLMKLETPTSYYGVIWTVLNLTVGLSALYSDQVERYFGMRKSNTFILLIIVGGYISLAYNLTYWGLAILFIFYIVRGFATPILKGYINQMTFSEMRATVLSIRNFVIRLIFAAIAPFIGWLNDFYSLRVALLVSAGIIAIPGILFLVLQFRKAD